jgi:sugar-specific transcriptional regulator TrmB
MNTETLRNLGFTEGEIKVYLDLLEAGRSPISAIARRTGLNRTALYDLLDSIIGKGLASYVIEDKKKYYKAAAPARIREYLDEKKEALEDTSPQVDRLVEDLSRIRPLSNELLKVEIYRGTKGIKTILEDVLKTCKRKDEVLAFGFGGSNYRKILGPYFDHWIKRREKSGIAFRGIFNESEGNEPYVKSLGDLPLVRAKYPFKQYETPTRTKIYGNKVAIVLMEKYPTAILIEDENVAKGYRYFYEFLWRRT